MKSVFYILRHTMTNWGALVAWCVLTVVSGSLGEKFGTPGSSVALVALISIHFVGYHPQWERTLRLLPLDPRKLILGRFLFNALAGVVSALMFALGLLLGGHPDILVELPLILGCTILIGAVNLPLQYKFMETNVQKAGVAVAGGVSALVCMGLMRREYVLVTTGAQTGIARILPVPLERGLVVLVIAIVGAVVSYFITCKLDEDREW